MSIDIYIFSPDTGYRITGLNMANTNAADLFRWIGLEADLWSGEKVRASALAPLCRRRLWKVERNYDPELPGEGECIPGVISMGRQAGYLREKTKALLKVCETALKLHPDADIYWG